MFKEFIPSGGWIKENARRERQKTAKEALKTTAAAIAAALLWGFIQATINV